MHQKVGPQVPGVPNAVQAIVARACHLALDNLVLFRFKVERPPNGSALPPDWPRGHIDASNKIAND
ncbi:MAG: hypothetical protein ACPGUV_14255, partial [Polyangiales bacterium]